MWENVKGSVERFFKYLVLDEEAENYRNYEHPIDVKAVEIEKRKEEIKKRLEERTKKLQEDAEAVEERCKDDRINVYNVDGFELWEHLGTVNISKQGKVVGRIHQLELRDGTVYGCICEDVLDEASKIYLGNELDVYVKDSLGLLDFEVAGSKKEEEIVRDYRKILDYLEDEIELKEVLRVKLYLWFNGSLGERVAQ